MISCRKACGLFGLVAGSFGLLAFLGLACACGYYQKTVKARAERLLAQADDALAEIDKVSRFLEETCDSAKSGLKEAREKSAAAPAVAPGMTGMILKNTLLDTPDKVRTANQFVVTASEGLLLAKAAFDSMHEIPMGSQAPSQSIDSMKGKIRGVSEALSEADGVLRSATPNAFAHISQEDATIVENAIDKTKGFLAEMKPELEEAQRRVKEARTNFATRFFFATLGTIAFLLLGAWGQACLIRLSLQRLRSDEVR